MAPELGEHVIEERHPCPDGGRSCTIEIEVHLDIGLAGRAVYGSGTTHGPAILAVGAADSVGETGDGAAA